MSDILVQEFYTQQVHQEWRRLVKNAYHRLEFTTTLHFLDKYMPPHGSVLDAGGGPGRYTLELAKKGYHVTLLDATQANLVFAKRMVRRYAVQDQVKQIIPGSIVNLAQFPEASFDGVLCLGGPLSHVLDAHERRLATAELIRVAKVGAPIFISVIGRFGVTIEILKYSQAEIGMSHFKQICETGDYLGGRGFTACHFFLPEEFQQALTQPDQEILEMAGLEGISSQHVKELNRLAKDEMRFKVWLDLHLQTCTHPAVVGMSEHMLIVCRKKQTG
jgi:SAM-dependent methyltransferase